MKSTTAILASRNLAARRRLGSAVNVTGQRGELVRFDVEPVPSTRHEAGRTCQRADCPSPAASLVVYNGSRWHYVCRVAALDAIGEHAGDAAL